MFAHLAVWDGAIRLSTARRALETLVERLVAGDRSVTVRQILVDGNHLTAEQARKIRRVREGLLLECWRCHTLYWLEPFDPLYPHSCQRDDFELAWPTRPPAPTVQSGKASGSGTSAQPRKPTLPASARGDGGAPAEKNPDRARDETVRRRNPAAPAPVQPMVGTTAPRGDATRIGTASGSVASTTGDDPSDAGPSGGRARVAEPPSVKIERAAAFVADRTTLAAQLELEIIGRRIGRFIVHHLVGRGGMGSVYRGVDPRTGDVGAIKVMVPLQATNADYLTRFKREAALSSRLTHPTLVPVWEYGEDGPWLYLTMPFVQGRTLQQILAESKKRLPIERSVHQIVQALRGVSSAHDLKIVHRDLKPDNLLVTPEGRLRVLDFGLARDKMDSRITQVGQTVGTPRFMSPEQWRDEDIGPEADVHALGISLYYMLSGRFPYPDADTPLGTYHAMMDNPAVPLTKHRPDVPAQLERVIQEMIHKNPKRRPRSAEEAANRLEACVGPVPGSQRMESGLFVGKTTGATQVHTAVASPGGRHRGVPSDPTPSAPSFLTATDSQLATVLGSGQRTAKRLSPTVPISSQVVWGRSDAIESHAPTVGAWYERLQEWAGDRYRQLRRGVRPIRRGAADRVRAGWDAARPYATNRQVQIVFGVAFLAIIGLVGLIAALGSGDGDTPNQPNNNGTQPTPVDARDRILGQIDRARTLLADTTPDRLDRPEVQSEVLGTLRSITRDLRDTAPPDWVEASDLADRPVAAPGRPSLAVRVGERSAPPVLAAWQDLGSAGINAWGRPLEAKVKQAFATGDRARAARTARQMEGIPADLRTVAFHGFREMRRTLASASQSDAWRADLLRAEARLLHDVALGRPVDAIPPIAAAAPHPAGATVSWALEAQALADRARSEGWPRVERLDSAVEELAAEAVRVAIAQWLRGRPVGFAHGLVEDQAAFRTAFGRSPAARWVAGWQGVRDSIPSGGAEDAGLAWEAGEPGVSVTRFSAAIASVGRGCWINADDLGPAATVTVGHEEPIAIPSPPPGGRIALAWIPAADRSHAMLLIVPVPAGAATIPGAPGEVVASIRLVPMATINATLRWNAADPSPAGEGISAWYPLP